MLGTLTAVATVEGAIGENIVVEMTSFEEKAP